MHTQTEIKALTDRICNYATCPLFFLCVYEDNQTNVLPLLRFPSKWPFNWKIKLIDIKKKHFSLLNLVCILCLFFVVAFSVQLFSLLFGDWQFLPFNGMGQAREYFDAVHLMHKIYGTKTNIAVGNSSSYLAYSYPG